MPTLFDQLRAEYEYQTSRSSGRDATTTIGGTTVEIGDAETTQTTDDTALVSSSLRGVPRGTEAYAAREIAETQPMQLITNAIVDQVTGGELSFVSDDEDVDQAEADLRALMRDVIEGPHLLGDDLDDLLAAWVADMIAVGNAYGELLPPEGGSDLPVAAIKPVDALTVRHAVDETGTPEDPPYYQAPLRSGGTFISASDADLTPLQQEDLLVLRYPGSRRSNRVYPLSPAMQVKEWLELLADSTTHHSRYYSDNELPPGLLTAREASQTDIDSIRDELEAAKGDPRKAPVVGTDARWVEVGGTAVDLSVIEEQQWFLQLVAAAFGVPKQELGLVEDVNRNTSEAQLTTIHKRVTQPLAKTIGQGLTRQLATQFDLYQSLGRPFDVRLRFSDPARERAQEEHLREQYQAGALPYAEYRERVGDGVDEDTTVEINGTEIDYGAYPKHVVEAMLIDARNDDPPGTETPDA